jgi:hypothetical protein
LYYYSVSNSYSLIATVYHGVCLYAEESGPTDTNTIVIELPENFLPTTDAIRLHFENEEYGGDDIKYLRLQPEKRRALVTFDNGKEGNTLMMMSNS